MTRPLRMKIAAVNILGIHFDDHYLPTVVDVPYISPVTGTSDSLLLPFFSHAGLETLTSLG